MAKKDVSAIISGMGVGLSILSSVVEKARKRGLGEEVIHQLATPEGDKLLDKFVDLMAEANGKTANSFKVTVDYDRTIEEMVAAGKYNWSNSDINAKNFPISAKGKVEVNIEPVHFKRRMRSDEVLRELDKQGLRPATLPELAALGEQHPELQREFHQIVALGSICNVWGGQGTTCLYGDSSNRQFGLYRDDGSNWHDYCRFAAVRK